MQPGQHSEFDGAHQVIDFRKKENAQDKDSIYELQIDWDPISGKDPCSWHPFRDAYREIPTLIQSFFSLKKIRIENILQDESDAAKKFRNKRGGNHKYQGVDWTEKNYVKRSFDDIA